MNMQIRKKAEARHYDFSIPHLGKTSHESPLLARERRGASGRKNNVIFENKPCFPDFFVSDDRRLLFSPHFKVQNSPEELNDSLDRKNPFSMSFEIAGPRQKLYFRPRSVRAAIVTCGGLSPGLNAVIRALVFQLWHRYGVRVIFGIPNGYQGLGRNFDRDWTPLTPDMLEDAHEKGGTILGTSRGTPPTEEMVAKLSQWKIDMLFCIGGDGTMKGAHAIAERAAQGPHKISVVGIPKTIDNDIPFVRRSFGFESAVASASEALHGAHVEATSILNGVSLVKLMGRHCGFIAANASLASGHVDFCLIPEVPFDLDGSQGLLSLVEKTLLDRQHCLIVVAEGAGQNLMADEGATKLDLSGNKQLRDIGVFLKESLQQHFKKKKKSISIKYIDPSYLIRATAANPADQLFCSRLAHNAVHAAMAGKTDLLIGYWHGQMTHVPLREVVQETQRIRPEGELWYSVLEMTGQPACMSVF